MIEKKISSTRGDVYYWTNDQQMSNELAIVFCHGLTADHTLFDKQVEYLANTYKLITWDYPLHGKSRPYKDFTYAHVNEELLAILKKEEINKIILVGQSAGGYIAQAFIREYPDKVAGFIGIGTTPFGEDYYKKSEMFWIKHFASIAKLYPYSYYCKACVKSVAKTREARENMYDTLVRLGKKGMLEATSAVYGEFLKEKEEVAFKCPVLITYGEYDKTGYVERYNKEWSQKTGYALEIIDNASHNANYDCYEAFNTLLINFLDTIGEIK